MQNFNLIAQSILKLSHREKGLRRQHPSGLNYSPRRKVFRRGQKFEKSNKKENKKERMIETRKEKKWLKIKNA